MKNEGEMGNETVGDNAIFIADALNSGWWKENVVMMPGDFE
jgi:hypothetical protein